MSGYVNFTCNDIGLENMPAYKEHLKNNRDREDEAKRKAEEAAKEQQAIADRTEIVTLLRDIARNINDEHARAASDRAKMIELLTIIRFKN